MKAVTRAVLLLAMVVELSFEVRLVGVGWVIGVAWVVVVVVN